MDGDKEFPEEIEKNNKKIKKPKFQN